MPEIKNSQIVDEAANWAVRIDTGNLSHKERQSLSTWLLESPRHVDELLFASSIMAEFETLDPDRKLSIDSLLKDAAPEITLLFNKSDEIKDSKPKVRWQTFLSSFAAVIAFIAIAFIFLRPTTETTIQTFRTVETVRGEQRSVQLEDGSILHVNTQSKIQVMFENNIRKIKLLKGEALFEVAHDPSRPFRVIAGSTTIEAIGTKFNVYNNPEKISVTVLEGKVAVKAEKINIKTKHNTIKENASQISRLNDGRVLLVAGQETQVHADGTSTLKTSANIVAKSSWRNRQLFFESDTLKTIIHEFNRYNHTQIIIADPKLAELKFSGLFHADDPKSFISFLQLSGDIVSEQLTPKKTILRFTSKH